MLIVRASGGIGNQMFQYAFYRSLQKRGKEVYFDVSWFDKRSKDDDMSFQLYLLNTTYHEPKSRIIPEWLHDDTNIIYKFLRRYQIDCFKLFFEKENCKYDPKVYNLDNQYLIGCWQTEKYFLDFKDILRKELSYCNYFDIKNQSYIEEMSKGESVSVHVRRGDYLQHSKIFGNICTEDYYTKAFDYIEKNVKNPVFYIFSNDIKWCRSFFSNRGGSIRFVEGNSGKNAFMDMVLMQKCKNHIIANSSFSWWGAWLSEREGIVLAPNKWFNGSSTPDIWSDAWIKL